MPAPLRVASPLLRSRSSRPAGPARQHHHRVHQCHNASQATSPPDCRPVVVVTSRPGLTLPHKATATSGTERGGRPCSCVMRGSAATAAGSVPTSAKPKPITSCRSPKAVRDMTWRTASAYVIRVTRGRRGAKTAEPRERCRSLHCRRRPRRGPSTDSRGRGKRIMPPNQRKIVRLPALHAPGIRPYREWHRA
jgi:hypothetical protein